MDMSEPEQLLASLNEFDGRQYSMLSEEEADALSLFIDQGRKLGVSVEIAGIDMHALGGDHRRFRRDQIRERAGCITIRKLS